MNLQTNISFLYFVIINFGYCHCRGWLSYDFCQHNRNTSTMTERIQQDILCDSAYDQNGNIKIFFGYNRNLSKRDSNKIVHVTIKFTPILLEVLEQEELLLVSGLTEVSWSNDYIKWDPRLYDSIDKFKFEGFEALVWYPKVVSGLYYDNSDLNSRILDRMDRHDATPATIQSNGTITLQYISKIYAPCQYDSEAWPFEEWTCDFLLAKSPEEIIIIDTFDPQFNIDTSRMKVNHAWKVNSDPPFVTGQKSHSIIRLVVKIERYISHYQSIFIYPGVALLSLSLLSFWFTNRICCRLLVNMLTTLVQLILLLRMITVMQDKSGSHGIALFNFYIDGVFVSLIAILFALVNDKFISMMLDPPRYMIQVIDTVVAVPFAGPVLAYFINEDNTSVSTMKYNDTNMEMDIDTKSNQRWRIISSFFDKFAFLILTLYFLFFYGLKLLL